MTAFSKNVPIFVRTCHILEKAVSCQRRYIFKVFHLDEGRDHNIWQDVHYFSNPTVGM